MFYTLDNGININYNIYENSNGSPLLFLRLENTENELINKLKENHKIYVINIELLSLDNVFEFINSLNLKEINIIMDNSLIDFITNTSDKYHIDKLIIINENNKINIVESCYYTVVISNEECEIKGNGFNIIKKYFNNDNLSDLIEKILLIKIIYEDNHVLVVDKPSGLLSQKEKEEDFDILDLYKFYLKHKYKKTGNIYLGLVQRLDRNVRGIMVISKTSKAHERLNLNRPEKTYIALIEGVLEGQKEVINNLSKDSKNRIAYESKDGKKAILRYNSLITYNNMSLLDIKIDTGRFHQIRCQLSLLGHPIINDKKYGSSKLINDNIIFLEAYKVEFIHPTQKEIKSFEIDHDLIELYKEKYEQ